MMGETLSLNILLYIISVKTNYYYIIYKYHINNDI